MFSDISAALGRIFNRKKAEAREFLEVERAVEDIQTQKMLNDVKNIALDEPVVPDYFVELPLEVKQTNGGWICIHSKWKQRTKIRSSPDEALLEMFEYVKAVGERQMEYADLIESLHDRRSTKPVDEEAAEG